MAGAWNEGGGVARNQQPSCGHLNTWSPFLLTRLLPKQLFLLLLLLLLLLLSPQISPLLMLFLQILLLVQNGFMLPFLLLPLKLNVC